MDTLLNELHALADHVEVIAYADDLACLIKGNTRIELQTHATKVVEILDCWCKRHKLKVSSSKTVAMLVKGNMNKGRLPTIKINGRNVKYAQQVKYLGVIIDEKLNFVAHARYIRSKITQYIASIRRVATQKWGMKTHIVKVLYGAVALPIVRYGSTLWYEGAKNILVRRSLMALQRALLLLTTRACRTTSTVAMQVIAGAKPMDLEVVEDALVKRVRRNLSTVWDTYSFIEREMERFDEIVHLEIEKIKEFTTQKWQSAWQAEAHGRLTYEFLKVTTFANINKRWFRLNRFAVYLITGYGPINSTLYKRKLAETNICPVCEAEEETTEHIIFECSEYQSERYQELMSCRYRKQELISSEHMLMKFNDYAKKVFGIRKEKARRESRGSASPWQGRERLD